jgi:hypothetical protein
MSVRTVLACSTAAIAALAGAPGALAGGSFSNLQPGVHSAGLSERVRVNVVFVGLKPGQINTAEFLAGLPQQSKPIVRSRLFYGVTEELGIDYTYDYAATFTSSAWDASFFSALKGLAKPAARTDFQNLYNDQAGTRDVGQNNFIDAPTVEKWLIDHRPSGVDTRQDTIFFINWWGRPDFIDHVYTKIGEPDPDTGYDFGLNRASRKIIAWGGTTPDDEETGLGSRGVNRVWFFDLSAGPESWGGSYDITNPDLDGDGEPDYRLPAAWEYDAKGYRAPSALTGDLSKVARYAAINLLFTSSPLYPPYLTPELLPNAIDVRLSTYEGWPGVNASASYEKPAYFLSEERQLFPEVAMTARQKDLSFTGKARRCYEQWLADVQCYSDRPQYPAFANLFLYNALNLDDVLGRSRDDGVDVQARGGSDDNESSRTYPAPGFNYATTDELAAGFLGFADDNWVDGTQSFVFSFVSQGVVDAGYGLTTTQIHEFGHHFGMSHPHDGFDWQNGIDYEPTGPLFFAWAGDESNSMMSYIDLNWDFSQFDRDNAARHQAAGYIVNANVIAGRILRSRNAGRAAQDLASADARVGQAKAAMAAHDYNAAWRAARSAYELVLRGAVRADVKVAASHNGWAVLPKVKHKDRQSRNSVVIYGGFDRFGPGTKRGLR